MCAQLHFLRLSELILIKLSLETIQILRASTSQKLSINKTEKKFKTSDFVVLSMLGCGTFGCVMLVKHIESEDVYAVKVIKKSSINIKNKQIEHIKHEKDNSNSIQLYTKPCKITIDFISSLILFKEENCMHLLRNKLVISIEGIKFYMAEVVCALEQLHKNNIIYRDLKLENIMIDKEGHIKLVDFGFSKVLENKSSKTFTNCGTPGYMAPEVLQK